MKKHFAMIALGLNNSVDRSELRERTTKILESMAHLGDSRQSSLYSTPAFPAGSGPDYINAAVTLQTTFSPEAILIELHKIEAKFDRERPYRWAPRSCDLDLIFHDQSILPSLNVFNEYAAFTTKQAMANTPYTLILPHPRMHERAFVLGPIREIAPDFVHPVYNQTIEELWQNLPPNDRQEIRIIR